MEAELRRKTETRVKRIRGQIAGVQRMIEEDRYCADILTQIAAVRSALDALGVEILTCHLESCVLGHGTATEHECAKPMTKKQLLAEVHAILGGFLR